MTEAELRAAIEWITACLRSIHDTATERGGTADAAERATASALTEDEQTRWDEGAAEVARLQALLERHVNLARMSAMPAHIERGDGAGSGPAFIDRTGDPFDLSEVRIGAPGGELRDRAFRAIEAATDIEDEHRSAAERLVRRHDTPTGAIARHLLATGSETYRRGFQKMIAGAGHLLTAEESRAVEATRALSLTDANGGYAVPFTLDPTIINASDGSVNPFRDIATVKTTVGDQWAGVSSTGMSVSWDGEGAEVSDDSPTLAQPEVKVHKAQGFAVGSIEVSQDWAGIEADLREMIANGKNDAEAAVFAVGTGDTNDQPTGIVTALAAASPSVLVSPGTAETFAAGDIYKVEEALGDRFLASATWLGNKAIYNKVRQLDTAGGANLWEQLGGGRPPQLIGYPRAESSSMTGTWNPSATAAHNYVLILGDFRNFVIVDRVGLSVEYIPHVFGSNGRPKGQRGWYVYWRVGSDSVNDNAFRMLDIPTAA